MFLVGGSHDRIPAKDANDAARFRRLENELVMLHRAYVEEPFGYLGVLNYNPTRSSPIVEMQGLATQFDAHDDLEGKFGAQTGRPSSMGQRQPVGLRRDAHKAE